MITNATDQILSTYFEIDSKYADGITWPSTAIHQINHIKGTVPTTHQKRNLTVNETKTEELQITRSNDESLKSCKLLGKPAKYRKYIKRRKILAKTAYNTLRNIFNNRKNRIQVKARSFNAYVNNTNRKNVDTVSIMAVYRTWKPPLHLPTLAPQ